MKDIKLMIEEYKDCLYFNEDWYLDALQGDPISICDIGTDFAREQNYENAVQCWLYLDRINKADASTYCNLGVAYYYGNGIIQNIEKAVHYYQIGAAKGHAYCQYNYAVALEYGKGGKENKEKAIEFYHKAALQGVSEAIDALCRLGCYDEMHGLAFYHKRLKGVSGLKR